MTLLSPAATYHAELRQQLDSVGRAISVQRGLLWLTRGLAGGAVIVLGVVIWAWTRDGVGTLPIPLLVALPIVAALLTAVGSLLVRHNSRELARRVDRAASLHERSTTALELGARGEEFPLAVAQMRDAVEHLRRVDLLDAFPLRAPRNELLAAFFVGLIAAVVAVSPNPWLLQARASNPSITIAREQAQRVQRVADSLQPGDSPEIASLRQLISNGAKTMDARSNEPDAALNSLQDLEQQVQQMSAGDDQLSAAMAAIANALAGNQNTQALSDAINTGDMHQVSQATKDLAQALASMSPQDRAQVAQALQDAASKAGASQQVANQLSTAADALNQSVAAANANASQSSQSGQSAQDQSGQSANSQQASAADAQAASNALNQLSQSAAAADARQRAASQLESSQNALERALGRTQSRSGTNNGSSSSNSNSSGNKGQSSTGNQGDAQSQSGSGQSQSSDQSGSGNSNANGSNGQNNAGGQGSDNGQGGGYSTGGDPNATNNNGSPSQVDAMLDPQQVPSSSNAAPNESSVNPYTSNAGSGSAQTAPEAVQPSYSSQSTQGNDQSSIPLGLRDLVKDYFSSLDQK